MTDQEQTSTTNDETNSADETTTEQSSDQSSSTTEKTDQPDDTEKIDLGTGKGDEDDKGSEKSDDEVEDKRTDEEKAADEAAEAERAKLFGAPEGDAAYEISGLPEGMEVDKVALDALTPVARKLDLSNEGMSAIAQVYANEVLPNVVKQITDGLNADVLAKRQAWETEARDLIAGKGEKLKTLTGDEIDFGGRALGEVQKIAAKALDKVAPAGFREWLDETGLGVHPQMIAFAYQIGKELAEDRDVEASETGRGKSTPTVKSGGMHTERFFDR